jgi:GntR family transcriptional regulator
VITRGPSLTEQVRQHLKGLIVDGAFEDGRIPPETELAADLGVSRTTVRDALSRLEHEGAIVRRQGAGTFINTAGLRIKTRLEEMWSYEQMLRDHGFTPKVAVIEVRTEPADVDTAAALEIDTGASVVVMQKVFYEDDTPVVLTSNYVPADLLDDPVSRIDAAAPIFDLLERSTGTQLAYYVSEIVPLALDDAQATLLEVEAGTPAIGFEETGFTTEGTPLVHARSMFRDDLVRLGVMRRRAAG